MQKMKNATKQSRTPAWLRRRADIVTVSQHLHVPLANLQDCSLHLAQTSQTFNSIKASSILYFIFFPFPIRLNRREAGLINSIVYINIMWPQLSTTQPFTSFKTTNWVFNWKLYSFILGLGLALVPDVVVPEAEQWCAWSRHLDPNVCPGRGWTSDLSI